MKITWRKQPSETGLRAIGQGPRGAILKVDGEDVGRVYPHSVGFHKWHGWYWTAYNSAQTVPLRNTCGTSVDTIEQAKAACEAYVCECLVKAGVLSAKKGLRQ